MEWNADEIKFSVDSVVFYVYNPQPKNIANWPYDQDQYLLLNIAMGSSWFSIDPFFNSSKMEIDYVRIYQEPITGINQNIDKLSIFPNPFRENINFIFNSKYSFQRGKLISILGKNIANFDSIKALKDYSWSSLKAGHYFLNLENPNSSKTYKIIKL